MLINIIYVYLNTFSLVFCQDRIFFTQLLQKMYINATGIGALIYTTKQGCEINYLNEL